MKLRQIAFADLLILNKVDLVGRENIAGIRGWLDEHFHRYRLIEAQQCDVPLEVLLGVGRFDPEQFDREGLHDPACRDRNCRHGHHENLDKHDHRRMFSTWSYETDVPLSLDTLREATRRLPASVYRCRGIVHSAEAPGRRAILQVVGKRADLSVADEWGARPPRTRIVAIGASDGIDAVALQNVFASCLTYERS